LRQLCEGLPGEPLEFLPAPSFQEGRDFRIDPHVERNPTLARRALYSLGHRGLRTLLLQVWVYIRRLLAPVFPYRKTT
jgi:hypothetical protein